eukprot:UN06650
MPVFFNAKQKLSKKRPSFPKKINVRFLTLTKMGQKTRHLFFRTRYQKLFFSFFIYLRSVNETVPYPSHTKWTYEWTHMWGYSIYLYCIIGKPV